MKYASEDLRDEHEAILFGLRILEEMAVRLDDAQLVETEDFADMISFFRQFADRCHHGKEEGFYFPALERAGIAREGGPVGAMLHEHETGRQHLRDMDTALSGEPFSPGNLATAANGYIRLLRDHIDKENKVLFVQGDQRIPMAEQSALLEEFERFENEVMGADTHERLHGMLAAMDRKYPA